MIRALAALALASALAAADAAPASPLKPGDWLLAWRLRGPFPKPDSAAPIGNEAEFAREPRCDGAWKAATLDPARFGDNLHDHLGAGEHCFAYAVTVAESPVDQDARLLLGSDDGYTAWVNGEIVGADMEVGRGLVPDQDRIPVSLRRGGNTIMLKITQGVGGWGFCARLAGLEQAITARQP